MNVPFGSNLECGACIGSGYIYCHKFEDGVDPVANNMITGTNKICFADSASCEQVNDPINWNCSTRFDAIPAAISMCPFNKAQCGKDKDFILSKEG